MSKNHQEFRYAATGKATFYTIGYEKRSIGEYINILKANNVAAVIDVRKNPFSRKKGFSKKALSGFLSDKGGSLITICLKLGIESSLRENLSNPKDYKTLFEYYETSILPANRRLLILWKNCSYNLSKWFWLVLNWTIPAVIANCS